MSTAPSSKVRRQLRVDSIGGASGDMLLAALIGLGVPLARIRATLAALHIENLRIESETVVVGGFAASRVSVTEAHPPHAPPEHTHHEHAHHAHAHHKHAHAKHAHRGLAEIGRLIGDSALPDAVKDSSVAVFTRLAEAEARVHGTTPDRIHFHEVGALDSIADIVGCCAALEMLGITEVSVGPLPTSEGVTQGAHGVMPLPVPAVVELLRGHPLLPTSETYELVTPTGAALLMTWRAHLPVRERNVPLIATATAYGAGSRSLATRPNLVRLTLMEPAPDAPMPGENCRVMECNLDNLSPELVGALTEALFAAGALDVYVTPIQMKKQRPGMLVSALATEATREPVLDAFFQAGTSLGVREYDVRRTVLDRRHETVVTPYGPVRVKIGAWRGAELTHAPEYADCVACAAQCGVPVRRVHEAALRAIAGKAD